MTIITSISGIDAYNNQFYNGIDLSQRISTMESMPGGPYNFKNSRSEMKRMDKTEKLVNTN
jgi:hypothetical protein